LRTDVWIETFHQTREPWGKIKSRDPERTIGLATPRVPVICAWIEKLNRRFLQLKLHGLYIGFDVACAMHGTTRVDSDPIQPQPNFEQQDAETYIAHSNDAY
jgi:hypothetical protein